LCGEVEGAKCKDADPIVGRDVVERASLVVPVSEVERRNDLRYHRCGVGVPPGEHDVAAPARKRRFDHAAGIDEPEAGFASETVLRCDGVGCDDGSGEPAEARGVATRIEFHLVDESRVNHRRAGRGVEQKGHTDAVEVVADISGRRAAHVEVGKARRDRRDTRHGLDGAKRIAECARKLPYFGSTERYDPVGTFAPDGDVDGRGQIGLDGRGLAERDEEADAGRHWLPAAGRGIEPPREGGGACGVCKWIHSLDHRHLEHLARWADDQLQHDFRRAVRIGGVGDVRGRSDRRCDRRMRRLAGRLRACRRAYAKHEESISELKRLMPHGSEGEGQVEAK